MIDPDNEYIGKPIWFPTNWERGEVDSVLRSKHGQIVAVIVRRADGQLISVDMQS
jgi:ABC-type cobalt transport system substrate-binding protein